jgi:hypothetical protein
MLFILNSLQLNNAFHPSKHGNFMSYVLPLLRLSHSSKLIVQYIAVLWASRM